MTSRTSNLTIPAILLCALPLGGCGGGGGPDPTLPIVPSVSTVDPVGQTSRTTDPTPVDPQAQPTERGKVILYLATSSATDRTYDPGTGITITSNGLSVLRYVPELDRLTVLAKATNFDFARRSLMPYTVDDRVFLRSGSPGGLGHDQSLREVDPTVTVAPPAGGPLLQQGAYQEGCGAVVGNRYYFEGYPDTDVFRRTSYGDLRVADLDSSASTPLLARGDADACRYHLSSAGGKLYDAEFLFNAAQVHLFRRDTATGRIAETVTLPVADAATWAPCAISVPGAECGYKFSFDDGVAYVARRRDFDQRVQVMRHRFGGPARLDVVYDAVHPGFALTGMDSHAGKVLLWDQAGQVLVIDIAAGTGAHHSPGFVITEGQILVSQR